MNAEIRTIPDMLVDTYGNQSELARRLHINRETISKYLNDKEAKHHAIVNGVFMTARGDCGKNRLGTHTMCPKCNGKGEVSVACCKCNGRGEAVNREETERQGVPAKHTCKQCSGRGYERIPTTKAFRAVSVLAPTLTLDVWKRGAKPFYEELISHIEKEESFADSQLKKITSRIAES